MSYKFKKNSVEWNFFADYGKFLQKYPEKNRENISDFYSDKKSLLCAYYERAPHLSKALLDAYEALLDNQKVPFILNDHKGFLRDLYFFMEKYWDPEEHNLLNANKDPEQGLRDYWDNLMTEFQVNFARKYLKCPGGGRFLQEIFNFFDMKTSSYLFLKQMQTDIPKDVMTFVEEKKPIEDLETEERGEIAL